MTAKSSYTIRLKIFMMKGWKKIIWEHIDYSVYPPWFTEYLIVFSHIITVFESTVSNGGIGCHRVDVPQLTEPVSYLWTWRSSLNFFFFFLKLILFFFIFYFTILYWFCHTSTCIRHGCTCVPHHEPPFHLPPHTIFKF